MDFKVGDKVRARGDCDNDMRGGEGIIQRIDGNEFVIRLTKKARFYRVGDLTNLHDWSDSIEFVSKANLKAPTHIVIWDEEGRDPNRFFTSKPEADDFIKELIEKSGVRKDSIVLVEIKTVKKIEVVKNLRSKEYKI